jgi:hypothetical protein
MVAKGWRVVPVRIYAGEPTPEEYCDLPPEEPRVAPRPAAAPAERGRPGKARKPLPTGGFAGSLLRCSD